MASAGDSATGPGRDGRDAAVIETRALTKRYPGPVTALDALTVTVSPGITGLVGANGAGKSTLIKILLGLLEPSGGQASVLGSDCQRDGERIRSLTGYMPEHDCLPPDVTATEFVTHLGRMSGLPPTAAKERAAESLRHVGLYEERYRQIGTYSTGMKQRVKLAQALVGDPRLLLLDEPTVGLDPAGRNSMLELIARIGAEFGISIVVASHLLGEIERICDHLVAIEAWPAAARRHDHQHDPGEPGPAGRGRRGLRPAAGRARPARPRARRYQRAVLVAARRRRHVRHRPGRGRRSRPAAQPAGAAAPPGGGTVPGRQPDGDRRPLSQRGDRPSGGAAPGRPGTLASRDRGHPRHRLPPVHRAAAGPGPDRPRPVLAQPAFGVRHRARRQGQDRAGDRLRGHVPARDRQRGRGGQRQRPPRPLRHLRVPAAGRAS